MQIKIFKKFGAGLFQIKDNIWGQIIVGDIIDDYNYGPIYCDDSYETVKKTICKKLYNDYKEMKELVSEKYMWGSDQYSLLYKIENSNDMFFKVFLDD